MSISFPFPVRVAVGIVASGVDRLRHLPGALPALSVTVAGQAMRASMRVQQEIADLAIRGDEVLGVLGGGPAENPTWAKFDDDPPSTQAAIPDQPSDDDADDESANDDNSVVDLPSRSSRRGAGTGPSHTRPARSSSARSRTSRPESSDSATGPVEGGLPQDAAELDSLAEEIAEITEITAEISAEQGSGISAEIAAELITVAILQDPDLDDPEDDDLDPGGPVLDRRVLDDLDPGSPVLDDPVLDDPVLNDPVLDRPVLDDLDPGSPVLDDPVLDDPVHDDPVHDGPVHDGPVHDGPVHDGPVHDDPVHDGPVLDDPVLEGPDPAALADPVISSSAALDSYPAPDAAADGGASTLPGYDALSLAELRGHLRRLSADQVVELVERETNGANRAPFLTLLTNRLTTLDHER